MIRATSRRVNTYIHTYSSTNHIAQCLDNVSELTLSEVGFDFHCRLLHRRGENTHFKVKTRVPEPFSTDRRSFLCTGAVVSHFVHRRGGFAKLCKTIAPVHENRSSAKSSKTHEKTPSFNRNRRTPRAVWPLFFGKRRFFLKKLRIRLKPLKTWCIFAALV